MLPPTTPSCCPPPSPLCAPPPPPGAVSCRAALHLLGGAADLNFPAQHVLAHPSVYGEPLKALLAQFQDCLQV